MPNKNIFPSQRSNGFTMIELVMVMVLAGILAIAVIPRFANKSAFDERGFFDQTIGMVRYAQKVAIAQRTTVFVNVAAAADTICLTYVADATCTSLVNTVTNPADQKRFSKTAPTGVTFNALTPFSFSPLGKPTPSPDPTPNLPIVITINGGGAITIERETGYVH